MKDRFAGSLLIVLLWSVPLQAGRISTVSASTDMGSGFGSLLTNAVNGVGLTLVDLTSNHAASNPSNSWVSSRGIVTGQVTFNLGGTFLVNSFSFWNQNGGGPDVSGRTGINGVQVLFSTDGVNFNLLPDGPASFAQVVSAGGPPQIFTFDAVTASNFRFSILSNYGDIAETGFAEVGFNDVPEPSTALAIALGLTALGVGLRKRIEVRQATARIPPISH